MQRLSVAGVASRAGLDYEADDEVGGGVEAVEREAYERGFKAGEKAGFELGRQRAEVVFGGISEILDDIAAFRESLYRKCEKEMVEICLAIAAKVVRSEVEVKEDVVLDCIREALKAVVAGGEITIRVNPKDLETLRRHKDELAGYGEGVKGVQIEADPSVARGGSVIETNYGEIDATIDSIMHEIEERLRNAY